MGSPAPSYSLGVSNANASAADTELSLPFVNNADIVFGGGDDLAGNGATSNPVQTNTQTPTATTAVGAGAGASGYGSAQGSSGVPLASPQAASGQSSLIWLCVAGVLVAAILHFKHK